MRIVTVLTSLGMGGAEKIALAVAERMAKREHAVALVVLMPRLREEWPTAIPVVHLDVRKNPLSVAPGFLRGRRFLRAFRPDVVHSHSFHANVFARLLAMGMSGAAVVSTVHNVYEGGRLRMLAYRLTDGLSRRTVAVSAAAAERFVRTKSVSAKRLAAVPVGIDIEEFAPDAARRARVCQELGAAGDECAAFVWLAAGRVTPAKDYPNLLRAFQLVRREAPETELWIAGAAADAKTARNADGSLHHYFALVGEKGFVESVRWLGLRRDMPALLDAVDGFVLASAWEGMPQVVAEAMAMEKPVAATDVGGVRELMGDTGLLVPAKSPEALAEAMLMTMRRSREERAQQGRTARERIVHKFSIDTVAEAWEKVYAQVMVDGGR